MASFSRHDADRSLSAVRWPLRLTRVGMFAEALVQSFWPLMTVTLLVLAALMLGFQDSVLIEVVWMTAVGAAIAWLIALGYAIKTFRLPTHDAAMARLDATLPGRPLQALTDTQTIGADDAASTAVWRAHQARMAERAARAEAVPADLRIASRDPYALRYVAALAFAVAVIFGSILRVGSVTDMAPGAGGLATGPVWEGWAESPRYTGRPTIYLNDIKAGTLELPAGSLVTLRLYGEVGALALSETVSGREAVPNPSEAAQDFTVLQDGEIAISGPGGRSWQVAIIPDMPPEIALLDDPTAGLDPVASSVIMDLIVELHRESCQTTIIASHDLRRLLPVCDEVVALFDGTIAFQGDVSALEQSPYAVREFIACRYDFDDTEHAHPERSE